MGPKLIKPVEHWKEPEFIHWMPRQLLRLFSFFLTLNWRTLALTWRECLIGFGIKTLNALKR